MTLAFDYIVAGGGTAGLVIANRLSEDPSITVAVVETGSDSTIQPQLGDRVIAHHAGKAVGGTTVINGLYYIRGDKADYDAWERLGNPGWNWQSLVPYFLRSEKFTFPTDAQHSAGISYNPCYHGDKGQLNIGFPYQVENSSFYDSARESCEKLGFHLNKDLNGGNVRGFGLFPKTLDRDANVRESAARAYYEPIDSRPNLQVIQGTVQRLLFRDGSESKLIASGVEYTDIQGKLKCLTANKEVIISSGTYGSPVILEASGIGNPSILASSGIQTKINLPAVGEAFQDQPLWVLMFQAKTELKGQVPFAAFATARDLFGAETEIIEETTKKSLEDWSKAIAQRLNGGVSAEALERRFQVQHSVVFDEEASMAELEFFSLGNIISMVFSTTLPFSWGSVHLNAAGEIDKPVIDPNFLAIDFDRKAAQRTGRIARELWSTKPLTDLVGEFVTPGEAALPKDATVAQWAEFLISACVPASHPVGTCAMLPRELGGVVDTQLKVYGTANVRVVDASVIPHLMSGHTSAAVYALAEKAADLIKGNLAG